MAYDRYAVELTDKDGQIYGVMDAEAREEVSELNSAISYMETVLESDTGLQKTIGINSGLEDGCVTADGTILFPNTHSHITIKAKQVKSISWTPKTSPLALIIGKFNGTYQIIANNSTVPPINISDFSSNVGDEDEIYLNFFGQVYSNPVATGTYIEEFTITSPNRSELYGIYTSEQISQIAEGVSSVVAKNAVTNANVKTIEVIDQTYKFSEVLTAANNARYRLNESDGFVSVNDDYRVKTFNVVHDTFIKIISDDRFQFQTAGTIVTSGTNYRVGETYGSGVYILKVPSTATKLVVSTPTDGSMAAVYCAIPIVSDVIKDIYEIASFDVVGWLNNSGNIISTDLGLSTDYIPVISETIKYKLLFNDIISTICFYDSNKNFISRIKGTATAEMVEATVKPPFNAEYLRATIFNPKVNAGYYLYQITKASDVRSIDRKTAPLITDSPEFGLDVLINGSGTSSPANFAKSTDFIAIANTSDVIEYNLYSNVNSAATQSLVVGMVSFYDINKNVISVITGDTDGWIHSTTNIPENAVYFRGCISPVSGNAFCREIIDVPVSIGANTEAIKRIADQLQRSKINYSDSLKKPFVFSGSSVVVFGDSIAEGVTSTGEDTITSGTSFLRHFCNHVNVGSYTSRAYSGSCITGTDVTDSISNRVLSFNGAADFIFIAGGVNDFSNDKTLGEFGEESTSTFYGSLIKMCKYLQNNYSDSQVIFITPIPLLRIITKNNIGLTMDDYRNAIYEVATYYGFNVVNGMNVGMPTEYDDWGVTMVADRLHPTAKGHELYATGLMTKLC